MASRSTSSRITAGWLQLPDLAAIGAESRLCEQGLKEALAMLADNRRVRARVFCFLRRPSGETPMGFVW